MFKKKMILLLISIGFILIFSTIGFTDPKLPGKGITVQPARATWTTGFFQEALVRKGLEALGYQVEPPKTLQNIIFF
jgi:glycine betaine/proline transport system substrate-binding protein